MKNTSIEERLRNELSALGAREFEVVALMMDPDRGLAALNYAQSKGAEHPISYAIKMFDNEDWAPSGQSVRRVTNTYAPPPRCEHCGGDRFVAVTDDWSMPYGESYAPCKVCNANANTTFYRVNGARVESTPA